MGDGRKPPAGFRGRWGLGLSPRSRRHVLNIRLNKAIITNRVLFNFRFRLCFEKISSYDGGGHAPMPPPLATLTTRPLAPNDEARHLTYLFCVHPIPRTFSGRFLQTVDVVGRGHARPIHGQLDVVPTTKHTTLYIQTLPSYMTAIAYEQIVNFTAINQQT